MTVEISVLGDIRTTVDGRPLDLGHTRRQAVFVGLLADANRSVPVDRLIDRVWGQDPPAGARSSLYSYVSRLRTALSATGGRAAVGRRPGGYALVLDEDTAAAVDLHRFRALAARARRTADRARALALFEEALGLWRADALGGLDGPWAEGFRAQPHLEQLQVELDRNDAALDQGRQAELLAGLLSRTRRHPLDERLAGQLMLALYREGRVAQALEHFERVRGALHRELGTDPGAELKDLHMKILTTDPSLEAPLRPTAAPPVRPAAAEVSVPVPRQLPPRPSRLAGRETELAALSAGAPRLIVISGLGGVGKTSLALHWAHDRLADFPDGQLYVNLNGFDPAIPAVQPHTVVRDFLTALGVDQRAIPSSAEAQVGLYRSLVAGKKMLVLLDNACDTEQVLPLIPGSPSCTTVITSRNGLSGLQVGQGAHAISLGPLTFEGARRLFAARIGEERAASEPEAVDSIISNCGRLPLALAIGAARAVESPHLPLAELASELHEAETRLDALDTGELSTSLRGVFETSYRTLPEPAMRLLGLLSLVPTQDVGLPAAAAVAGLPPAPTRALLRTLESAHLLGRSTGGRYGMHDLVRLYGRERAGQDLSADADAALRRLIGFYADTANVGTRLLAPHDITSDVAAEHPGESAFALRLEDRGGALEWFTTEKPCFSGILRLAEEAGLHRAVWRLAWDTYMFFRDNGYISELPDIARAGLDAADRLDDADAPFLRALAHRGLAGALLLTGKADDEPFGHLAAALSCFEDSADDLNQAHTLQALTLAFLMTGDPERAVEHAEHSLELYLRTGSSHWKPNALNTLGWCLAHAGRYEAANERCQEALRSCRASGEHRQTEAAVLDSLGFIATRAGRHREAVGHYHRSLRLFQELGNTFDEADTLSGLAEAHAELGEQEAARDAWSRALGLYRSQHRTEQARQTEERLRAAP